MRLKTRTWVWLSVLLVMATALVWWQFAHSRRGTNQPGAGQPFTLHITNAFPAPQARDNAAEVAKAELVNAPSIKFFTNPANATVTNPLAYRLSNTRQPIAQLARNDRAVLLRNALIDTAFGLPAIPVHLQSEGDPGAYIVQARGPLTDEFRTELATVGATIVSYVPNNAYLVRATAGAANALRGSPLTQSVLPYEPYYKLDSRLLPLAVNGDLLPHPLLNIVIFPGETARVQTRLTQLGVIPTQPPQSTPYGDVIVAKVPADKFIDVAKDAGVHMLGVHFDKKPANDLTRVLIRIARDTTNRPPPAANTTYYAAPTTNDHLSGQGVLVGINDTGSDDTHPDLQNRVFGYTGPGGLKDPDGHGTHVTGILLGNGTASPLQSGAAARGSVTQAIFSGMAPRAQAFVQNLDTADDILQRNTALTNALISNNSWGFPGDNDYDIFAASYDAAVRDSLPGVTGEQQVLYVFACGNEGGGGNDGLNGIPGSVISPATAKNVISVGASDLPRFITNEVYRCITITNSTSTNVICETNLPWYGMTDTNNQVSPFSSRGNVGIGIEGQFGRFKPDVVAPGAMLVSCRSSDYIEPTNSEETFIFQYNNLTLNLNQTSVFAVNIPGNAIRFEIFTATNILTQPTNMSLLLDAAYGMVPPPPPIGTNDIVIDANSTPALQRGLLYYSIANAYHSNQVNYDLILLLTITNNVGNYFEVLSNLNYPLRPRYRYEAGTSMAAPAVSGMLACMQEFLGTNSFGLPSNRPSPALLKALLINGARSLSPNYNLQINAPINHQGWGLVSMSNSIPSGIQAGATNGPMRFYDQRITNALATGGTETYEINVPDEAKSYPLRVTLVWSDPPGNPITGIKLVNDLNLSVLGDTTNTVVISTNSSLTNTTSLLWLGNNFPPGSDFTEPIIVSSNDTNQPAVTNLAEVVEATRDFVNNVENVYIRPPLSSKYTVVVKAHRVNVNAINSHSNSVVQDYALVISSGNVAPSNKVNLVVGGPTFTNDPVGRIAALQTPQTTNGGGSFLFNQRVGANSALIVSTNGATNQWCFFTYTNLTNINFTNVVILTFLPPELSLPRFREADIDLYVSRNDTNLFVLEDNAIANSTKSLTRGGTELVLFQDAQPGEVFYIGVKSEDQQAANFAIYAASSDKPFSSRDGSNNIVASAIGLPQIIPDGTADQPGGTNIMIVVFDKDPDVTIQRLYVTNGIYHEEAGDLIGILSLVTGTNAVTLNNHRTWTGYDLSIYDDSGQGDLDLFVPTPIPPDGPGRLRDFVGENPNGVWDFAISDNALFHTGYVDQLTLVIEPNTTNGGNANIPLDRRFCVNPNTWVYAAVNVPFDVFNMETCVSDFETIPSDGKPIAIYIKQGDFPDFGYFDDHFDAPYPGACDNLGLGDNPPLSPGRWYFGFYNSNSAPVCFHVRVTFSRQAIPGPYAKYLSVDTPMNLIDDAKTNSVIFVPDRGKVADLKVGLRVDHERASDLVFHLTSPNGTRLLLFENRGTTNMLGIGANSTNVVTNVVKRLLYTSWEEQNGFNFPVGTILSGWRVDLGNVDVEYGNASGSGGFYPPSHTGTNALDINGNTTGAVSRSVRTTVGKTYRLSFAFCKNRNVPPPKSSRLDISGQAPITITYNYANGPTNLNWVETNFVFKATTNYTRIAFTSLDSGVGGNMLDTIALDEIKVETNLFIYTTFTENTNLTMIPIKFGLPPFTNGGIASLVNKRQVIYSNDFETVAGPEWTPAPLNTSPNGQGFIGPFDNSPLYFTYFSNQPPHNAIEVAFDFYAIESWDGNPPWYAAGPDIWDWNAFGTNVLHTTFANFSTNIPPFYDLSQSYPDSYPTGSYAGLTGAAAVDSLGYSRDAVYRMIRTFPHSGGPILLDFAGMNLQGIGDEWWDLDNFQITAINAPTNEGSFYLPEEPMKPFVGQQARGFWNLEVWDSRLGGAVTNIPQLISWKLEIAFPQTNPPVILLTNGSVVTNIVEGEGVVYFAVDLPCDRGFVTNTLQNLTFPNPNFGLDLVFDQFVLPTNGPNDVVLLTAVTNIDRSVLTIGTPPLITTNRYYLAVFNENPNETNQFVISINVDCVPPPVRLTNHIEYCTTNAVAEMRIFEYIVSPDAVGVFIDTLASPNGDIDLYAQYQVDPIPGVTVNQSATPGTGNEHITLRANIGLIAPGLWKIGVTNKDVVPVQYCILVTEIYNTNVVRLTIPDTVTTTIGATNIDYYVVNIASGTCDASFLIGNQTSNLTFYAAYGRVPSPADYDASNVALGGGPPVSIDFISPLAGDWYIAVVNTNAGSVDYTISITSSGTGCLTGPTIQTSSSSYSTNGFTLKWDAPTSQKFQVQYTESLSPPNWQTNSTVITSGDGHFQFLDAEARTNRQRFYRLERVP